MHKMLDSINNKSKGDRTMNNILEMLFTTNNLLFTLGIFVSNIIQGLTGFAGSLLAMPPSIHLKGLLTAKVAVNTYGLVSSFIIFITNYKNIDWKAAAKVVVLMIIGLIAGIYLTDIVKSDILLKIYAVFIILVVLKDVFFKGKIEFNDFALIIIVLLAGVFQGLFVSGGPLLIIYVSKKFKNTNQIRGTLGFIWIFINGYLMINQIIAGQFTKPNMIVTLIGLPAVFIGVAIGNKLANIIDKDKFMKVVHVLLIISAVSLL